MRSALVAALVGRAERSNRLKARRFLGGLSSDELQFMAEFLGACILESAAPHGLDFQQGRWRLAKGQSEHWELKMILLQEYLCCSGLNPEGRALRSGARFPA